MADRKKTDINTCYICNTLRLVERHYQEWICNACYKIALRIWSKDWQQTREQVLTLAITRRQEIPLLRTPKKSKDSIAKPRPIGRKNWED